MLPGGAAARAPLRLVERTQRLQRRRLEDGAAHHNLVQDGIRLPSPRQSPAAPRAMRSSRARLGRVEDEVKLAHALEAAVQRLHIHCGTRVSGAPANGERRGRRTLDEVQDAELALRLVAQHDEVQRREVAVDQLRVLRATCASGLPARWRQTRATRLAERRLVLNEAAQVVGCAGAASAAARRAGTRRARTAARHHAVHRAQQLLLLVHRLAGRARGKAVSAARASRPLRAARTSCS